VVEAIKVSSNWSLFATKCMYRYASCASQSSKYMEQLARFCGQCK